MALIELRGISKIYHLGGEEIRALDNVDLDIETGEFISIIGPSGSGKSTLMHISLAASIRPAKGASSWTVSKSPPLRCANSPESEIERSASSFNSLIYCRSLAYFRM
jgi:ABC-type lipoprotein export system ATPase subunit